ncbi:MAG: hypothetical protein ACRCUT_07285 [Spirochaetota bacterium]
MTEPLPAEVRAYIVKKQRKNFIAILKKLHKYNPFIAAVLFAYFFLKKLGITATFTQCTVVLVTASALTVGGIGAGTYTVVKEIQSIKKEHVSIIPAAQKEEKAKASIPDLQKMKQPATVALQPHAVKYAITVDPIDSTSIGKDISAQITQTIQSTLPQIRILQPTSPALTLIGSIKKTEATYLITVRVFDKDTGRIHFAASEQTDYESILIVTQKIAKELAETIE